MKRKVRWLLSGLSIAALLFAAAVILHGAVLPKRNSQHASRQKIIKTPVLTHSRYADRAHLFARAYSSLPLSFELNEGQANRGFEYVSHGPGYALLLSPTKAAVAIEQRTGSDQFFRKLDAKTQKKFELRKFGRAITHIRQHQSRRVVHAIMIDGANPAAKVDALDQLPEKSNYFIGRDSKKWRSGVPNYSQIRYKEIYPGIELIYYGRKGRLEFDFVVSPGANPKNIALRFDRSEQLTISRDGSLRIGSGGSAILLHRPNLFQMQHGIKHRVQGGFALLPQQKVAIRVGSYDRAEPLVIDPVLVYSSYLGVNNDDADADGIGVDSVGNIYVTGSTPSLNFPIVNGYQNVGNSNYVAFIAELNPSGSALLYSTYLGGTGGDYSDSIAVSQNQGVYVTGYSFSTDFPIVNGLQTSNNNTTGGNAFMARIDTSQTGVASLVYSTYLGGGGNANNPNPWLGDAGMSIAADPFGRAYITGNTVSDGSVAPFPTTASAFQSSLPSSDGSAFLTVIDTRQAGAASLIYSTYLGGDGVGSFGDYGTAVAVDTSGHAYVVGQTTSDSSGPFPTTANAYQTALRSPNGNVFLSDIDTTQSGLASLVYSTYFGGSTSNSLGDYSGAIALDSADKVYIAGDAVSTDFPITAGAFQSTNSASGKAFVAKFDLTQSGLQSLVYSTFVGGMDSSSGDGAAGVGVDGNGDAFIAGSTSSTDFPVTSDAFQLMLKSSGGNVFLTEISPDGTTALYSTYLGGSSAWGEGAFGLALDPVGNAYITGTTESSDFPTTAAAFRTAITPNAQSGFVAKFALSPNPTITSSILPAANLNGWNNSPVTVMFSCTPGPDPIANCSSPLMVRAEGASQAETGTATDTAGNTATTTATVNLDITAPALVITSPSNGASVSTGTVAITGTIMDALSGPGTVNCHGTPATLNGTTFSCNVQLASGANSISVIGTDLAGNSSSTSISVTNTGASGQSNPPFISGISPTQGGIDGVVTVSGSAFGTTQGASVVMFNGIPAQVSSWSDSSINASVPAGLSPGTVTVNVGVNGSASNGVQFTVTAPLFINPNQITMLVGDSRPIELVDENGIAVTGATWIVGNGSVAHVIPPANGQPAFLQADAPGITTLTGNYGSRTGIATVTVLPTGTSIPPGTVIWSVPSLGSRGMRGLVHAVPSAAGPKLYAEDDGAYGGNGAIRAFDENGQQLWIWPPSPTDKFPLLIAGDNQGGVIYFASQDTPNQYDSYCYFGRVDQNGNETWEYQETNCWEDHGVAPDGTIYLVEPEYQNNGTATVVALDPTTGQIKFTIPLPGAGQDTEGIDATTEYDTNTGNYYAYCTPGTSGTTNSDTMANDGLMSIDANGNVYIPFSTSVSTSDAEPCDSSPDPNDPGYPHKVLPTDGSWTFSQSLQMMTIHPDGSYSTQQLDSASGSGTNAGGGGQSGGFSGFDRAVPDGQGGVLLTIYGPPTLYHASSSGVSKYSLPIFPPDVFEGSFDPKSVVLGESGTAFLLAASQSTGNTDTVDAINVNSGAISWSHSSQSGTVSLVAATGDGGVLVNDSQGGVAQLDATGNSTSTGIIGAGISLSSSWDGQWFALNFPGTNNGIAQVALSNSADPDSFWASVEANPSASENGMPMCPCDVQSAGSSDPPSVPISSLESPEYGSPSCTTLAGSGLTDMILVGDPGLGGHNAGQLFDLAAQQKAIDLNNAGDNVVACRVSSVDDILYALTGRIPREGLTGQITGQAFYFGHSGTYSLMSQGVQLGILSILAAGQDSSNSIDPRPNVDARDVHFLADVQTAYNEGNALSPSTSLLISGCRAGLDVADYYARITTSIAQLIANNIKRGVYAYTVGLYFGQQDAQHDTFFNRTDNPPSSLPMYMVPVGVPGNKPMPKGFTPR